MEARCQCGAVVFTTPTPKPLALYVCHCHDCRRQFSAAFSTSAIFPRFHLPANDNISCYAYFCKQCGTRLLHATPGKTVVAVKGGCLDGLDWREAIHIWAKMAMVPIPEGRACHAEAGGQEGADPDQPDLLHGGDFDATKDGGSV